MENSTLFEQHSKSDLEQKQLAERIENLPTDDTLKADLILVWKGYKKATEIGLGDKNEYREESKDHISQNAEKLFTDLGLSFAKIVPNTEEGGEHHDKAHLGSAYFENYIVAGKKEDAELLLSYLDINGPQVSDSQYGAMYGFPKTAVEAFANREREDQDQVLGRDELPEEIQAQDYAAFIWFMLSKDHWQQELEEIKERAETIKSIDPALYERMVKEYHEHRYE